MTRSRASAKTAGTRFESLIAAALAEHVHPLIERRRLNGSRDRGDITGLAMRDGGRVVIECKDHGGRIQAGVWLNEAETERINDNATAAFVIAKRRGVSDPLDQIVLCTVADLIAAISGERP